MDLADKKIIACLSSDASQSHKSIGKKIRLSKEVVRYRVNKLEESGIIKTLPIVDFPLLNFTKIEIYLLLPDTSVIDVNKLKAQIRNPKSIACLTFSLGTYNMCISIRLHPKDTIYPLIHEIEKQASNKVLKTEIVYITEETYFMNKFATSVPEPPEVYTIPAKTIELDQDYLDLIQLLYTKKTLMEIAKASNISLNTVIKRLKFLKEKRIIRKFSVTLDFDKIDLEGYRILVKHNNQAHLGRKITEYLGHVNEIDHISTMFGRYSLEFDYYTADHFKFIDFISQLQATFGQQIEEMEVLFTNTKRF